MTIGFRAVASMRQDEAVASSWFSPFFFEETSAHLEGLNPEQAWLIRG